MCLSKAHVESWKEYPASCLGSWLRLLPRNATCRFCRDCNFLPAGGTDSDGCCFHSGKRKLWKSAGMRRAILAATPLAGRFSLTLDISVLEMVWEACLFLQRSRDLDQSRMTPRCHFGTLKLTACPAPPRTVWAKEPQLQLVFAHCVPGDLMLKVIGLSLWFRSKGAELGS